MAGFDHVAIPVGDMDAMLAFYQRLGFGVVGEDEWRAGKAPAVSVVFGPNKINLHPPALWQRPAFTLRAPASRPGCGDFCFVWEGDAESLTALLRVAGVAVRKLLLSAPDRVHAGLRDALARDPQW